MAEHAHKHHHAFNCRSEAVADWLESLPRGSVGKTAELLYGALKDIRRQTLKPADRFQTLEAMRETIHFVTSGMRRHYAGKPYPLPDKLLLIASACRAIYEHTLEGYLSVHQGLAAKSGILADKKLHATAIHRALVFLNQALLNTYNVYAAFQHDYWEKLHSLYAFAERHAMLSVSIYDPLYLSTNKSTIEHEYCRATLLYLSEPYHLRPGEIDQVNSNLDLWRGLVSIEDFTHHVDPEETRYPVIELDRDQPPQTAKTVPFTSDIKQCRYVKTDRLLEKLTGELNTLIEHQTTQRHDTGKKTISIGLLRRLIDSWGQTKRRRYPRQQSFSKVNVTLGLHKTHMQLVYEQHLANASVNKDLYSGFSHKPKFESIEVKDVNREMSDIWSTVYSWANETPRQEPNEAETEQFNILDYRVRLENWTLLNESAEGFCLMCVDKQHEKIRVGELISIQRKNQTNSRSIGIIRWLKAYGSSGVEIGGMLLAPMAEPAGMIIENGEQADHVVDRGLLLPVMPTLNRPESLVTFSRRYKTGNVIRLTQTGKPAEYVTLVELVADNGTISQFLFTRHDASTISDSTTDQPAHSDVNPFSDVWSSL